MQKQIRNVFLILALLGIVALVSFRAGKMTVSNTVLGGDVSQFLDISLMSKVRGKLEQKFLEKEKLDEKNMSYGAISGMVSALGDPYTVFLPPKENTSANADLAGEFGGVGIQLGYKDKNLAVMAPLAKTPADRAGVRAGDVILKIIDKEKKIDKDTTGISLEEAVSLIRGKIGTEVTLELYREEKKDTFEVTLKRDNIVVPSMELEWVEKNGKKVAWIKLYKFSEQIYKDWPETVDNINSEKRSLGAKFGGIVLDLRNNPGGFLQASVLVASDFIDEGVVVTQRASDGSEEVYRVDSSRRKLLNDKLVVLVNGGSASAAEILAGALKEYKRAKLVGVTTFGKGTVQQPENFADGSGLHVTIAKWLLPNGVNIHGVGVSPEVEEKWIQPADSANKSSVESKDNQFDKALEVLLN